MSKAVKGINKVLKQLKKFVVEAEKMVEETTASNAKEIARDAKVLAPIDLGKLRQSIFTKKNTNNNYSIVASARYAPYIEFGTGAKVNLKYLVDAGIPESYALQFKGKGIKQVNIQPRPYLYPAFIKGRKQYLKDLKGDLEHLTKKYND